MPCLERCPHFRGVLIEGFHSISQGFTQDFVFGGNFVKGVPPLGGPGACSQDPQKMITFLVMNIHSNSKLSDVDFDAIFKYRHISL